MGGVAIHNIGDGKQMIEMINVGPVTTMYLVVGVAALVVIVALVLYMSQRVKNIVSPDRYVCSFCGKEITDKPYRMNDKLLKKRYTGWFHKRCMRQQVKKIRRGN